MIKFHPVMASLSISMMYKSSLTYMA